MADNDNENNQPPDFAADRFQGLRQQLIEEMGLPEDDIAQQLEALWVSARRQRQQQAPDQDLAPDPEPDPLPIDKKKSPLIVDDLMVSENRTLDPSEYALGKLRKYHYVELWYFTLQGCTETARPGRPVDTDTLTFTCLDNILELQPSQAVSHSKNVIQDQHLSWAEMSAAKNNLIEHAKSCGWAENLVIRLMQFYLALDTHPLRKKAFGDQVLLTYQAEVRRHWHQEMLKGDSHPVFNIAKINGTLMREIEDDLYRQRRERALTE